MENNYLPDEVSEEWIDGIIDFLPLIYLNEIVSDSTFPQLHTIKDIENSLTSFPRILNFITVQKQINFDLIFNPLVQEENSKTRDFERKKLIKLLLKNIQFKNNVKFNKFKS